MSRAYDGLARSLRTAAPAPHELPVGYIDARRRVSWAAGGLVVVLLLLVVSFVLRLVGIVCMGELVPLPQRWQESWADLYDTADALWSGLFLVTFFLVALLFIRAQRGLLRNHAALHARPRPGVTWGSWAWFVPFANLVVPVRSIRQISRAARGPRAGAVDRLVSAWWGLWLLGNVGSGMTGRSFDAGKTRTWFVWASAADAFVTAVLFLAGVCAIVLLRALAAGQRATATRRAADARASVAAPPAVLPPPLPPTA